MSELYPTPVSGLLYGGPGSGKSTLAVDSMFDWRTQKPRGRGMWITIGREDNPALLVPEEFRTSPGGMSLRLTSTGLNDLEWVKKFEAITDYLLLEAKKGNCYDSIVIDGMSEFDLLYEAVFANINKDDGFAMWNALLSQMFASMIRLDPNELNANVLVTARVMEKKKAKTSARSMIPGDPNYIDFDYYPSLRGSFRLHLPHYFNFVTYMETQMMMVKEGKWKGRKLPAHVANMVRTGEYYVKNQWEHGWLQTQDALELVNPRFPDLYDRLLQSKEVEDSLEIPGELIDAAQLEHVED